MRTAIAFVSMLLALAPSATWAADDEACDVKAVRRRAVVPGPVDGSISQMTVDAKRCPHLRDEWTWLVFGAMADAPPFPRDPIVVAGQAPEPVLKLASAAEADDGTLVLHLTGATPLTIVAIPPGQEGVRGLHLTTRTLNLRGMVARQILVDGRDLVEVLEWGGVGAPATLDTRRARRFFEGEPVREVRIVSIGKVSLQLDVQFRTLRTYETYESVPRGDFPLPQPGDAQGT